MMESGGRRQDLFARNIWLPRPAFPWHLARTAMTVRTVLATVILISCSAWAGVREAALSPAEALKSFQLEPGLTVELAAAEPLTIAPVAISFDEAGRMFVAENRGYPNDAEPPLGQIALLEDKDADGKFGFKSMLN